MFEEQLEEEREFKTTKIYQEKRAGAVFYVNLWQHELFFHNVKLNFSSNSENKYNLFKFAVLICQKTGFDLSYKDFFKPPSNKNFIEQNEILRESVLQYKKAFDEILLTAVKKQKKIIEDEIIAIQNKNQKLLNTRDEEIAKTNETNRNLLLENCNYFLSEGLNYLKESENSNENFHIQIRAFNKDFFLPCFINPKINNIEEYKLEAPETILEDKKELYFYLHQNDIIFSNGIKTHLTDTEKSILNYIIEGYRTYKQLNIAFKKENIEANNYYSKPIQRLNKKIEELINKNLIERYNNQSGYSLGIKYLRKK